ncbi:BnaCnng12500D [Brassica napus]|uniref:BnaCnng12500D protein n=1 Tax=Brassica napus TaxID=3708 RepID=A0A078I6I1_BRANA|nr:BnaCnng12500D [Brassica napus]
MDKTDSHFSSNKYEKRIILKTETSPLLSFHSRGTPYSRAPLSLRASLDKCSSHDSEERLFIEIFEPFMKRMFFDTPRTWILYEPMDRNKSLLLAMTSFFITSSLLYPSPLFSVTHQMALSSYL